METIVCVVLIACIITYIIVVINHNDNGGEVKDNKDNYKGF